MATACETVVLGRVRELPLRVGFRVAVSLGRVNGYGVTGAWGVSRAAFAGEGVGGGRLRDGDSDAAKTGASAVPRPSLSSRKRYWVCDVTWLSTCAARLYRVRWGPRCCEVHWSTGCDDKRRGWMLYWLVIRLSSRRPIL